MNSDYGHSIIARQRQQELAAEAAADRLARLAARSTGRTPWRRRLRVFGLLPKPGRTRSLTAHRVAH